MAISLGGAGGGSEVNDNKAINSAVNTITTSRGEVWLKSGVISTDTTAYPNATTFAGGAVAYSGTSVDTGVALPAGLAYDGTHVYVSNYSNSQMRQFNTSLVYQNVTWNGISQNNGVAWDSGTSKWYMANTSYGDFYRYASNGTRDTSWAHTSEPTNPQQKGLISLGGHLYCLREQATVRRYSISNGSPYLTTVATYDISSTTGTAVRTIAVDGDYFWVFTSTGTGYKFNASGVYQNVTLSLNANGATNTAWGGVAFAGANIFVTESDNDKIYKFSKLDAVGLQNAVNTDGGTIYTRIK